MREPGVNLYIETLELPPIPFKVELRRDGRLLEDYVFATNSANEVIGAHVSMWAMNHNLSEAERSRLIVQILKARDERRGHLLAHSR